MSIKNIIKITPETVEKMSIKNIIKISWKTT
jgi:hypothetical protein